MTAADLALTPDERALIAGGIDLHTHSSPSIFPRLLCDAELAAEAAAAGLRGVVLKAHESSTVDRANALDGRNGVRAFGGLVLNHHVGGLNPLAVEVAIRFGGKVVWMPTVSARQHQAFFAGRQTALFGGRPLPVQAAGLSILDEAGRLRPEVQDILAIVAAADVILSTGHLPWLEAVALVDAALAAGVRKMLIGHADLAINPVPLEVQVALARKGAYLEKCYLACTSDVAGTTLAAMAESIRQVGSGACVLVTDYGQPDNISPARALARFCRELHDAGISAGEIRRMVVKNPAHLLGLS